MKTLPILAVIAALLLVSLPSAHAFGGKRLKHVRQIMAVQLGADVVTDTSPDQVLISTRGSLEDLEYAELSNSYCAGAIEAMLKAVRQNVFGVDEFHPGKPRERVKAVVVPGDLLKVSVTELERQATESAQRVRLAGLNELLYRYVHTCYRAEPELVLWRIGAIVNLERSIIASQQASAAFLRTSALIIDDAFEIVAHPSTALKGDGVLEQSRVPVAQALATLAQLVKAAREEAGRIQTLIDSRKLCAGVPAGTLKGVDLLRDPTRSIDAYLAELQTSLRDSHLASDLRRLRYLDSDQRRGLLVHYLDKEREQFAAQSPLELSLFMSCAFDAIAQSTGFDVAGELQLAREAVRSAEADQAKGVTFFDPRSGD